MRKRLPVPFSCIPHLLEHQAKRIPNAPAILAPGRGALTYRLLYQHTQTTGRALRSMGVGRNDRVVVALPNGPEMAVAILGVAANAICIPMNPAYQGEELERYFTDLRPRALIVQTGGELPARAAALRRGVRIIELSPAVDDEAGAFTLIGGREDAVLDEAASAGQVAVLLLTSGTTARPKIVPQTHANICASAYSSTAAWELCETDRCINMLPLFHGHGLHNTLMASLAAGASVVCTPGWEVDSFFKWLCRFQPTWYSAVATIHQAILGQARNDRAQIADCRLRFIRCGSAPLRSRTLFELEKTFEAPVIEYYAMADHLHADCLQSHAAGPAQSRIGRETGELGRRDHGRGRPVPARATADRRDCCSRQWCHAGISGRPDRHTSRICRRLAQDGRLGLFR